MELKLENTESERTHELANLIRAYNRANREQSKSEPLNFNFQAPKFYEKHSYKEVFTLKKYPYTGERYYYTKEL